jgi:hypothetical protein
MAVEKYTFNKLCDSDRLSLEISESAIITAEDHIETASPSTTDVYFKDILSQNDEGILNDLVAAHVNTPLPGGQVDEDGNPVFSLHTPKDSDESIIFQPKTTKLGWHFSPRNFRFVLGTAGSLDCLNPNGTSITDIALKFYNSAGTALTKGAEESDVDFQTRLDTDCVATAVDWYPTFDLDIISGAVKVKSPPTGNAMAHAWLIFAPAIPAQYGGSISFGNGGICLGMFNDGEQITLDGRGVKRSYYDAVYRSNEIRSYVRHTAGLKTKVQVTLGIYRA